MTILAGGRVLAGDTLWDTGWLRVSGDRIGAMAPGVPPSPPDVDLTGLLVLPGFVDVHVHGGGGVSYSSDDPEQAARVVETHRRHGTTTALASLVTATPADLARQVSVLAELADDGLVAGIHLEGPWLSPAHRGAHDPTLLRPPDPAEVDRLLALGRGHVRSVTLAPELDGGLDAVRQVVDAGAVAAVGHTDATYDLTRAAVAAGATIATHVFNAMRPLDHREPGPVLALLDDDRVTVEVVADGVHLHPAVLRHVVRTAGADRVALVTDAMAAAGAGDGTYRIGQLEVSVARGVARLPGDGAIAGSTLTLDAALRRMVHVCGLPVPAAARMAATVPARALGLAHVGELAVGRCADLVVLDDDLHVLAVMARGAWLDG